MTETTPDDSIDFEIVTNNSTDDASIKLIALKNIFSRQLPKMPREYIVRLVFDPRHFSLAITKGGKIIGGICYRPFSEQRFAEIAFLAINSTEQVRGYGTILMNQLKLVAQREKIEYFLTYADNFATGYFQKQGFTSRISMPKERWFGYIKDYDGGTLMECYIHPAFPYTKLPQVLQKQRSFILARLQEIYGHRPNDTQYELPATSYNQSQQQQNASMILEAPGVAEAGWNSLLIYRGTNDRDRSMNERTANSNFKLLMDRLKNTKFYKYYALAPQIDGNIEVNLPFIDEKVRRGRYYFCQEALANDLKRCIESMKPFFTQQHHAEEFRALADFQTAFEELFHPRDGGGSGSGGGRSSSAVV